MKKLKQNPNPKIYTLKFILLEDLTNDYWLKENIKSLGNRESQENLPGFIEPQKIIDYLIYISKGQSGTGKPNFNKDEKDFIKILSELPDDVLVKLK